MQLQLQSQFAICNLYWKLGVEETMIFASD
uniref:Uncharacterized protein n=1 Tax=Rhizophora mucronata TaxID=61149 RepID=A0A2P2PZ92_RHIMU